METQNLLICGLGVLGFYGTWGRTAIDGTLRRLLEALHEHRGQPYLLPGTTEPMKTCITGIYYPVDYLLDLLILFFWEAVDGSHPTTSLVALYFAAQHLSISILIYVDSHRSGNSRKWQMGATLWLLLFQLTAIGTSGPCYVALYLSKSALFSNNLPVPIYRSLHAANPTQICLLPFSATVAYVIPAILMGMRSPSTVSYNFKQLAIAAWNVFPLTMALVQFVLQRIVSFLTSDRFPRSENLIDPAGFLHAVRIAYGFAFAISCATHIGIASLLAASVLFPMIFSMEYSSAFRPNKVVLPPVSWSAVATLGEGDLGFMKWDQVIGYSCVLFVAGRTYRHAEVQLGRSRGWIFYAVIAAGCLIVGPGSTAVAINWAKDEMLFAATSEGHDGIHTKPFKSASGGNGPR